MVRDKDVEGQLMSVIKKHRGSAGIIYVLRRRDADDWSELLRQRGLKALGYHAGMPADAREQAQDRFMNEDAEFLVVIHPKKLVTQPNRKPATGPLVANFQVRLKLQIQCSCCVRKIIALESWRDFV